MLYYCFSFIMFIPWFACVSNQNVSDVQIGISFFSTYHIFPYLGQVLDLGEVPDCSRWWKMKRTLNLDFTSIFPAHTHTCLQRDWTLVSSQIYFCKHLCLNKRQTHRWWELAICFLEILRNWFNFNRNIQSNVANDLI